LVPINLKGASYGRIVQVMSTIRTCRQNFVGPILESTHLHARLVYITYRACSDLAQYPSAILKIFSNAIINC